MLTACAMGLGSCVIGATLSALNKPEVKAEFGIQADFLAVAPIIVGYPSAEPRRLHATSQSFWLVLESALLKDKVVDVMPAYGCKTVIDSTQA